MGLSSQPEPQTGSLQGALDTPNGGGFDALLPVQPRFVFIRESEAQALSDGVITTSDIDLRVLDYGEIGEGALPLQWFGPWSVNPPANNPYYDDSASALPFHPAVDANSTTRVPTALQSPAGGVQFEMSLAENHALFVEYQSIGSIATIGCTGADDCPNPGGGNVRFPTADFALAPNFLLVPFSCNTAGGESTCVRIYEKVQQGGGIGACCLAPGQCIEVTQADCDQNPTGIFLGEGSLCQDAFCIQEIGAWCNSTMKPPRNCGKRTVFRIQAK